MLFFIACTVRALINLLGLLSFDLKASIRLSSESVFGHNQDQTCNSQALCSKVEGRKTNPALALGFGLDLRVEKKSTTRSFELEALCKMTPKSS